MRVDEILIVAVIVMLMASIFMGLTVQRSLRHSQKAFEALIEKIDEFERRVAELEQR